MLVSAAVLPHPPLLVPALAGAASEELDGLRNACQQAIAVAIASAPDVLVVVGGANTAASYLKGSIGSFRSFGLDVAFQLPKLAGNDLFAAAAAGEGLPLSLSVAAYLLSEADIETNTAAISLGATTSSSKAQHVGAEIAAQWPRVSMLAMGDGSACLSARAPGYIVEGAADWQQQVGDAMAVADFEFISRITEVDSERFQSFGRAAWQVMAGAATFGGAPTDGWSSTVHYNDAPYGVAYLVSSWLRVA